MIPPPHAATKPRNSKSIHIRPRRSTLSKPIRPILGERFIRAFAAVKRSELEAYQRVISSWEREHLLLNV